MEHNLITNIESCKTMIQSVAPIGLLYYSHIPTSIIALIIGFFVFFKNKGALISKILLGISLSFSLWCFFDLILWLGAYNSPFLMLCWSLLGIINIIIFTLSIYFVYVFADKKDMPIGNKLILGILSLPILLLTPTSFNLKTFNVSSCEAVENSYFTNYYYYFGFLIFVWIVILFFYKYKKIEIGLRRQFLLLTLGIELFLLSFFTAGYIASLTDNFNLELYGLFGMPIFMGFLAYLIVKFKAFNVKLLGVQALVITLVILIGSQFAFIRSDTNKILTSITLVLSVGFGWILIRSVRKEIKHREDLEIAKNEIEKRNREIESRNKKLKRANKEIDERRGQLQLISDSLAIANDKLKKLDTAKTEFVSMASHQLRTPPTPIKGYSSMLLEGSYGELNAEQRRAIENIAAANNQQIAFVEDLLNVSRIESGSMKFEFKETQIGELCQEVINNLVIKAKDKGLYLEYKTPATPLPELMLDGTKIREVISNLVDNALKYTKRGGVTLLVELCTKKQANCLKKPHLRITVSDTGIGIPAEEIPYLFQKFSRGKDTARLNTGGTGLGLYVAKMITEANGGKVWIESAGADRGSKFIVELPLKQTRETLERNG